MTIPVQLKLLAPYTIIETERTTDGTENNLWVRIDDKSWSELSYHCNDCAITVYDTITDRPDYLREKESPRLNAEAYFGNWKLRAIGLTT